MSHPPGQAEYVTVLPCHSRAGDLYDDVRSVE